MRVTVEDGTSQRVIIDSSKPLFRDASADWDGTGVAARVVKASPERRYTLHVAYPANKPDVRVAADGYRDFAGEEATEDAAWYFMAKSRQIGLWHAEGTDGAGECVESYVYRGPDWTLTATDGTTQVIKAGDWLIGVRWHPDIWPKILSGEIGGVSMQGQATRRKPSPEALARLRR